VSVTPKAMHVRYERGSVIVLMAVALFPIMFLAAFAIDVSHWWDYSRNLQNRADAAALAAGGQFGSTCIGSGAPGTTGNGAQSVLGKWAQLYSGAGVGEPVGNLPYTDAAVSAAATAAPGTGTGPGTGWPVATNGYLNNTKAASPVVSPLTLRLGNLNNYWLILNGNNYAENGGTNFSMTASGTGATFCSSDPKQDLTDPARATAGPAGPMVDVKVSQKRLPLFFQGLPGFANLKPNIHAHARVQLQGEASSPSVPIAVSDSGFAPCVSVKLVNASTNAVIQTVTLTKATPVNPTDPITWTNALSPASFTLPASANVYVQPFLNDCNGGGNLYDGDTNSGLLYINNYGNSTPIAGQPPSITTGGVTLTGTCTNSTQYFSVGACNVQVTAHVAFAVAKQDASVTAVDIGTTPNQSVTLNPDNTGTVWTRNQSISIGDTTGQHPIRIDWQQTSGTVNGQTCGTGNGQQPPPCTGSFGVQAQAFGACNGCDQPDDSGPIAFARISEGANNDVNAFAANSTHNLVFTIKLAGIFAAQPGDPPTVLRFPVSSNHTTGLADCGQGGGTNADAYVVYYGCGPGNPHFTSPPLNPLFKNERNGDCSLPWPAGNHQDCVQTTPGTRRQGIICPLVLRIVGAPFGTNCNNQAVGTCPPNYWTSYNGVVPGSDPRALVMIISSAADFGSAASSPQAWIPIRRFATFYITGWDSSIQPQCPTTGQFPGNEPFPIKGKQNNQNAAVWGHWTSYVDVLGTGDNQSCPIGSVQPVNCVPVQTR
jgi:hypothetical protein